MNIVSVNFKRAGIVHTNWASSNKELRTG